MTGRGVVLIPLAMLILSTTPVCAQAPVNSSVERSPQKAALLSLVLPGLGHRYASGGHWTTTATTLALADISTWLGIAGSNWRRNQAIEGYTSLAATRALADVDNKDRRFFLNLATYKSSDEFLESALRNRAWDQISYVDDAAFQWEWQSDRDFARFRDLRSDAESLRRRKSVLIAVLVANRAVAGITSILTARRGNLRGMSLSLAPNSTSGMTMGISWRP